MIYLYIYFLIIIIKKNIYSKIYYIYVAANEFFQNLAFDWYIAGNFYEEKQTNQAHV